MKKHDLQISAPAIASDSMDEFDSGAASDSMIEPHSIPGTDCAASRVSLRRCASTIERYSAIADAHRASGGL